MIEAELKIGQNPNGDERESKTRRDIMEKEVGMFVEPNRKPKKKSN